MRSDESLLGHIRAVHRQHRQAYGAKKTWRYLNAIGIPCGKHRVARLRKQAGIEAQRKRRFRLTVEHHHTPKAAPDLLQRQFTTQAPNRVWVGDMTFMRTRQGWLHLVVLLDLFSRKVVGWSMGNRATTVLHQAALAMAITQRRPAAGLIHHADRGALYSAAPYLEQLAEAGIQPSMNGRKRLMTMPWRKASCQIRRTNGCTTTTSPRERRRNSRSSITSSAFIILSVFISFWAIKPQRKSKASII